MNNSTAERSKYQRTYEELEQVAVKFWPLELARQEADLSVIPLLLSTQDRFLSMIGIEPKDIDSLYSIIESTTLPANLFVKHLMVLSDMGGESFRRISREFKMLFPHGELKYTWRGDNYTYNFKALPDNHLNNITLRVDGKRLPIPSPLSDRHKDAIAIMMFGSIYSDEGEETSSILLKGEIGDYLGSVDI